MLLAYKLQELCEGQSATLPGQHLGNGALQGRLGQLTTGMVNAIAAREFAGCNVCKRAVAMALLSGLAV